MSRATDNVRVSRSLSAAQLPSPLCARIQCSVWGSGESVHQRRLLVCTALHTVQYTSDCLELSTWACRRHSWCGEAAPSPLSHFTSQICQALLSGFVFLSPPEDHEHPKNSRFGHQLFHRALSMVSESLPVD